MDMTPDEYRVELERQLREALGPDAVIHSFGPLNVKPGPVVHLETEEQWVAYWTEIFRDDRDIPWWEKIGAFEVRWLD